MINPLSRYLLEFLPSFGYGGNLRATHDSVEALLVPIPNPVNGGFGSSGPDNPSGTAYAATLAEAISNGYTILEAQVIATGAAIAAGGRGNGITYLRVPQFTLEMLMVPLPPPRRPTVNGNLIGLTLNQEEKVSGWHRHPMVGSVESIAVKPSPDGKRDELWMIVERTIDGATKRYIEYLTPQFDTGDAVEDAFFGDSGMTYDGTPAMTILGLDHLEGMTVGIWADGMAHAPKVVIDGAVTLDRLASKVQIGLPAIGNIVKMKLEAGAANGTAQSKIKRIHKFAIRLLNTLGGMYGEYGKTLDRLMFRKPSDPMDVAIQPFTGDIPNLTWPDGYTRDARLQFYIDDMAPATVVAIYPDLDTQDGG
jgi:hypothetical protein